METSSFYDLHVSDQKALIQYCFICELEKVSALDDFYRKQKIGLKVTMQDKLKIILPQDIFKVISKRVDDNLFLNRHKKGS